MGFWVPFGMYTPSHTGIKLNKVDYDCWVLLVLHFESGLQHLCSTSLHPTNFQNPKWSWTKSFYLQNVYELKKFIDPFIILGEWLNSCHIYSMRFIHSVRLKIIYALGILFFVYRYWNDFECFFNPHRHKNVWLPVEKFRHKNDMVTRRQQQIFRFLTHILQVYLIPHYLLPASSSSSEGNGKTIHCIGTRIISKWMDENSNNAWLFESIVIEKFNRRPYSFKCVRVFVSNF